jgi:hypothetical protein
MASEQLSRLGRLKSIVTQAGAIRGTDSEVLCLLAEAEFLLDEAIAYEASPPTEQAALRQWVRDIRKDVDGELLSLRNENAALNAELSIARLGLERTERNLATFRAVSGGAR